MRVIGRLKDVGGLLCESIPCIHRVRINQSSFLFLTRKHKWQDDAFNTIITSTSIQPLYSASQPIPFYSVITASLLSVSLQSIRILLHSHFSNVISILIMHNPSQLFIYHSPLLLSFVVTVLLLCRQSICFDSATVPFSRHRHHCSLRTAATHRHHTHPATNTFCVHK